MQPLIGILGGMGPMASQLFYKMVTMHTKAEKDQDHINLLLLSDASMPDRTAAILSGQYEAPYQQLLDDAMFLEKAGCQAIAITCNTAHFFVDMIEPKLHIPILHMIRETAEAASRACSPGARVGVMATDGTVRTGLYQKALEGRGLEPYTPPAAIQREVMHQIYDRIKSGLPCDAESWERIEADYRGAGCQTVILACTELSVIKADEGLSAWYMDPMEVLARTLITFAGKTYV